MKRRSIVVRTEFEALHNYPDAPDEVSFLRHMHRHKFYVTVEIEVNHNDRDLEFFIVKKQLDKFINTLIITGDSCEGMADSILDMLTNEYGLNRFMEVSVFEDNENGAKISVGRE